MIRIVLSEVHLRNGERILLDDFTVDDVKKALQTKTRIVQSDGKSLIDGVLERKLKY
ncbi:DUF512 domain-containing protein [Anaerocolumna cellulosilytica]|uniref:DUF512 domain-containing protein n=1 Tax=Anaerocolumna cellulosilytica TaxID=433286 RepID=UPI001619429E